MKKNCLFIGIIFLNFWANAQTLFVQNGFTILDAGSLSGTFATVNYATLPSGLSWTTTYDATAGTVILSVSGVLPVELLSFKATPSERGVILDWATALEDKTDHFKVERSRDGRNFTPIGTVKAKGSNSEYAFTDDKVLAGIYYYRLAIQDSDGKKSYSKIVSVLLGDKTFKIKVYPTLVVQDVFVSTDGGSIASYQVVNMMGQIVLSAQFASNAVNPLTVSLNDLPDATYLIQAQNTEGITTTVKVVKQTY
ncbi:MAG: hypothetical protein RLZZ628_829 [Bacteroidota bacterium]|jgi:hypothetical protein